MENDMEKERKGPYTKTRISARKSRIECNFCGASTEAGHGQAYHAWELGHAIDRMHAEGKGSPSLTTPHAAYYAYKDELKADLQKAKALFDQKVNDLVDYAQSRRARGGADEKDVVGNGPAGWGATAQ